MPGWRQALAKKRWDNKERSVWVAEFERVRKC